MTYFQNTTDASDLYRPTSAAETSIDDSAVRGNLADLMRNRTLVKATFLVPRVIHHIPDLLDADTSPTSRPVW